MDTQNKTIQLKFKFNDAAYDNYGESFASFASIATVIVFTVFLGQFIPAVIALAVSVVLGFILMKAMSASFKNVRNAAKEENKKTVNELIAPYGLGTFYDGRVGEFDRITFFDKVTEEEYRSVAGSVNGSVATIIIAND